MRSEDFYKKLIQRVKSGVRASRIPRSFSKKKNNVFSNEQHIVIQVLRQLEGKALRDMPSFLTLLQKELHLARAIHFTTINKFALIVKQTILEVIIARMVRSNESSLAAIDGTGFSLNARSPYFCTIAGERNQFMQTNVCAEVRRRLIARKFPSEIYRQRVIIESIFSAVKRRFGHTIYARKFNAQKNELLFRFLAYNAEKLVNLSAIEVYFLQSSVHIKGFARNPIALAVG